MGDPRGEAADILGGDFEARVLEPSPPAIDSPPFADDPAVPGEVPEGREVVSPVSHHGDLSWEEVVGARPELSEWCADRWLAAWRPLEPLPEAFAGTRDALHRLAEQVVAPERMPANEIALRWTRGGFGTPFFELDGRDSQVRVEGADLVRQRGAEESREPIPGVDAGAARALGALFGFGCSVLEELRGELFDEDPSLVQLWPEHFDIALELGVEASGKRANYGLSPGDADHPEPYLYVGPWSEGPWSEGPVTGESGGPLWNANGFNGAELGYAELLEAGDQRRAALDFMRERHDAL